MGHGQTGSHAKRNGASSLFDHPDEKEDAGVAAFEATKTRCLLQLSPSVQKRKEILCTVLLPSMTFWTRLHRSKLHCLLKLSASNN